MTEPEHKSFGGHSTIKFKKENKANFRFFHSYMDSGERQPSPTWKVAVVYSVEYYQTQWADKNKLSYQSFTFRNLNKSCN